MLESSARAALPVSAESDDAPLPSTLTRLLHDWPDATAIATIVAVACTLFWLTWAHWGSIEVDCGTSLYLPVQILHGKLLYRDLWFCYGPLVPYLEAFLLALFGQHLAVFYLSGLAITIACALLLFGTAVMLDERAAGLVVALAFLFQGFGPIGSSGSQHNFIFTYTYTTTLGLLLTLWCLFFTLRHILGRSGHDLMLAGLAAGLALLCKQEFGAACYIGLAFALGLEAAAQRSARTLLRGINACAPGVALCGLVYGWFFWELSPGFILLDNWLFFHNTYFMRVYGARYVATVGLRLVPSEIAFLVVDDVAVVLLWILSARISCNRSLRWLMAGAVLLATVAMIVGRNSAADLAPMLIFLILFLFPKGMFFVACGFAAYTFYKVLRELARKLVAGRSRASRLRPDDWRSSHG